MIISIFASIWAQNLWDELILKNEIKLLEKKYWKDTEFIVFSYDYKNPFLKKSNVIYKEYFPIWIKKISYIFRNIRNFFVFLSVVKKSDLIVVWWGWIIFDNEKYITHNPLNQWLFRTNIFRFFKKKILFFAVWLNIKNSHNYTKIKHIFKHSEITVRDNYSFELLKKLWINSTTVEDPVFNENSSNKNNMMIKKVKSSDFTFKDLENIDLEWKKVALALRANYLDDDLDIEEEKINNIIDYILENWWEVILLPHSFHKTDLVSNDYLFMDKFLRVNEKTIIVTSMEDVYGKYLYSEFDICIAMRLHSMILSQVYGIPFIWISYSIKTDEVLEKMNLIS